MSKVLIISTICCVFIFSIVGVWGYLTFVNFPGGSAAALEGANILYAPYPKSVTPILIGNFALFFVIATVSPLCVLPAKNSVEEIVAEGNPNRRLSNKENLITTIGLVVFGNLFSMIIPDIESAMTLIGSTIDPAIGFYLPIAFYWKSIEKDNVPICSWKKI